MFGYENFMKLIFYDLWITSVQVSTMLIKKAKMQNVIEIFQLIIINIAAKL